MQLYDLLTDFACGLRFILCDFYIHIPYYYVGYSAVVFDRYKHTYMMVTGKISVPLKHFIMQTWD
jgi:hypothetical protein